MILNGLPVRLSVRDTTPLDQLVVSTGIQHINLDVEDAVDMLGLTRRPWSGSLDRGQSTVQGDGVPLLADARDGRVNHELFAGGGHPLLQLRIGLLVTLGAVKTDGSTTCGEFADFLSAWIAAPHLGDAIALCLASASQVWISGPPSENQTALISLARAGAALSSLLGEALSATFQEEPSAVVLSELQQLRAVGFTGSATGGTAIATALSHLTLPLTRWRL